MKKLKKPSKDKVIEQIEDLGGINISVNHINGHDKNGPQGIIGYVAECQVGHMLVQGRGATKRDALVALSGAARIACQLSPARAGEDAPAEQPADAEAQANDPGIATTRPIRDLDQA